MENNIVYLLQHLHVSTTGDENVKIIGIYATNKDALLAIDRLEKQPGFKDYPNLIDPLKTDIESGFYIDKYTLNKDNWKEGFI